jgi:hypothetical protein
MLEIGITIFHTCCMYAYRISAQESTRESPFFLLYGRDARQPLEEALDSPTSVYMVDLDDYKSELVQGLTSAWDTAECNKSAQNHRKSVYDRNAKNVKYQGSNHGSYAP